MKNKKEREMMDLSFLLKETTFDDLRQLAQKDPEKARETLKQLLPDGMDCETVLSFLISSADED
jgi:hypothetical protein